MPHSFFTTEKQGDIITRMNTDISGVSTVISGTLSSIVSNVATVITTLVALFSMDWKLAIVGIAIIPLLILPTKSAGKKRWELLSLSQEKNDELNQVINETLSVSGSMLVKIFTREEKAAWLSQMDGAALGSDAFFPFSDNIERAKKSGVKYIVQPGGSVRDDLVIETADKYGIAMAFTGIRLFHH